MDGAKAAIVRVRLRQDQLHEIPLVGALDTDAVTAHHLLPEPELPVFSLQHREEGFEALDYDKVLDLGLS